MPKKNLLIALIAVLVGANSMSAGRIRQNFDFGWKFRLGEQGEYKTVQLPHDWSISLDFNKEAGPESGYLPGASDIMRRSSSYRRTTMASGSASCSTASITRQPSA